ncbi:hypothetical protein ACOSP7_024137 [Xanthoceras sorbifolium]
MFEFNATVTFLGQRHEIGTFLRDYISLQMLWESTMIVTLKRKLAVGERLIQHVPIPWSGENRAVHSDSDLMDVLAEFEAKKTLTNEHTCLAITKNRDANSTWLGKKFQDLIKENPDISIRVLHGVVLRTCGLDVNNHTLRRAKTYAMNIGGEAHKASYNKLYKFKVDYLRDMFWPAARSSNAVDFEIAMGKIRETSVPAYDYLMQIPKHQWSVHEFDQECKSDHNTNNVVEAFNGWLSKLRALPMLTMMENIRRKIMKRIHRRYEAALKWETNIPPAITRQMQKAQQKGRYLDPLQCGEWEFEVVDGERRFVVNLDSKTCECGLWAVSGIPCRHALACILKRRDAVEGYVHDYLKKPCYLKTYSHAMHPIPDEHLWPNVEFATVLPPLKRRRPGRPKLQRRRGLNEPQKVPRSSSLKCSICHEVGHNSRTCKKKNDGQSGGNQGTTTSSTPSTSTATNRRRMEVSFFLLYLTPTNRNAKTNIF